MKEGHFYALELLLREGGDVLCERVHVRGEVECVCSDMKCLENDN